MSAEDPQRYAPLHLEVENERVWQGEQLLELTLKAFAVLHYLVAHSGSLVSRDELLRAVWPETVVSEWALTTSIRELRRKLRDGARSPHYIETVHRRGYRFIIAGRIR